MKKLSLHARHYPEIRFGGFTDVDGTIAFYQRISALIDQSSVVLDVGCGRGAYADDPVKIRRDLRIVKGRVGQVIGIDLEEDAADNPFLDEFRLINADRWPAETASIDMCICDNVLEHVVNPAGFFDEVSRVLSPGGHLAIRTPNLISYFGLLSRATPARLQRKVAIKASAGERRPQDVFPTHYRCNSKRRLESQLRRHGFDFIVYGYEAEPSYFSFSPTLYRLAVAHQRLAPRSLRLALFAFARKASPGK